MSDAARAAKSSFQEIKDGAREMGAETGGSMTEARHGVMLLGEEFGIHLPRGLTTFIASLGPVGAAMEAAFPFLAIIVGATLLLEHLAKLKNAGGALTESQQRFGTVAAQALNSVNDKLLEVGIRADELSGNHLDALEKKLQLIDHQSLRELQSEFDKLAGAMDATFAKAGRGGLMTMLAGEGAADKVKTQFDAFKAQYQELLQSNKGSEARGLLVDEIIKAQDQLKHFQGENQNNSWVRDAVVQYSSLVSKLETLNTLQDRYQTLTAKSQNEATQSADNKMGEDAAKVAAINAASQRKVDEEEERDRDEHYRRAVSALQESEREKIEATDRGSQARIAAIDAALKEEQSKGLQEESFYKGLLTERVQAVKAEIDEEKKLRAEAAKESADHTARMDELDLASRRTAAELARSSMMNSDRQRLADEIKFANESYQIELKKNQADMAALNQHDNEYNNKLKALQDKQTELTRAHANEITAIKVKAEEERNQRILTAARKYEDELTSGLSKVLMRQESASKMMMQLGNEVVGSMMQNALKAIIATEMSKESDAAKAARDAYKSGVSIGGPFAPLVGAAYAAAALATVTGFEAGGIVPGVGKGDIVPAMLEPGESVLPKRMTENLQRASHDTDSRGDNHVHVHITHNAQAFNSDGIKQVLADHGDQLVRHVHNTLRKMNK